MKTTDVKVAQSLAMLLRAHGVSRVVLSPGSRNAPLLLAVKSTEGIDTQVVVDERQAAFLALGMAQIAAEPVALICTSGSAPLNYMPAVAEAYYSRLPLIVVTADRPPQWIGQDDSQTIRQPRMMNGIVKKDYHIPPVTTEEELWYAQRLINDALLTAVSGARGPVHINIAIDEPIGRLADDPMAEPPIVRLLQPQPWLAPEDIRALAMELKATERVMVVCGFMHPDKKLNQSLAALSRMSNVAVLTETIANLHSPTFVPNIDAALAAFRGSEKAAKMSPQLVITVGGALVSRHLKEYLRGTAGLLHWHVSTVDDTIDCFKHLSLRIATSPAAFFSQLAASAAKIPDGTPSEYAGNWQRMRDRAISLTQAYLATAPWSDFAAMAAIHAMIPRRWNVQYSNGTPIRYSQIFGFHQQHRVNCNRGVSGIDGCTSTAVGASLEYRHAPTLLITGDTSAMYDIAAIALPQVTPRLKVVLIDNGGGGIFRFIKATSQMPIVDGVLSAPLHVEHITSLAISAGFSMYEAENADQLSREFKAMAAVTDRPCMLVVRTSGELSARVLNDFFTYFQTY